MEKCNFMLKEKISDIPKGLLQGMYKTMLTIRLFEEKIVELYPEQEMKCPVHLCIGEEATAAGVSILLRKEDYSFSNHRCHGHYIAKGGSLDLLMAELYGKKTGCSKGKGGSMHLVEPDVGFPGSSAIVSGTIPIAVGSALAFSMKGKDNVAVVFFGDGAVDEGTFYESLNFASLKKLPVIFVCENNFYATNSPQLARQPADNIAERAIPFKMPGVRVDGNNAIAVYRAAKEAIGRARKGLGPSLIECRTYRWKGHVGHDDDTEKGFRSKEELRQWMEKCPLVSFENLLLGNGVISKDDVSKIKNEVNVMIKKAVAFGKKSPYPSAGELSEDVFA